MSADTKRPSILLVDDSAATLEVIERNLEAEGYRVHTASDVATAVRMLESEPADLVITDVKMPKVSGLDLVRHVRDNYKSTQVTVITGYPSVDGAVTALKRGATDYLIKPFTDEELLDAVRRGLARAQTSKLDRNPASVPRHHGLVGESDAMRRVFREIEHAARTAATVLVRGESGTGKELVARAIHYASERSAAAFVPINCGAIPHELLESELFGHVKGAFTGATESRMGFFVTADRGTLFLDEISETSPTMQVKLLRVLQEREIYMVGSSKPHPVNVRIIAATNKDPERLVSQGALREDLYYRIHVLSVEVPPLRERQADIPLLAHHFADKFASETGCVRLSFADRALDLMCRYPWPGNVRELENLVHRLAVMSEAGSVDAADLPALMRYAVPADQDELGLTLAEMEARHVRRVLDSVGGNKTRAADILGIDRGTLRAKLGPSGRDRSPKG